MVGRSIQYVMSSGFCSLLRHRALRCRCVRAHGPGTRVADSQHALLFGSQCGAARKLAARRGSGAGRRSHGCDCGCGCGCGARTCMRRWLSTDMAGSIDKPAPSTTPTMPDMPTTSPPPRAAPMRRHACSAVRRLATACGFPRRLAGGAAGSEATDLWRADKEALALDWGPGCKLRLPRGFQRRTLQVSPLLRRTAAAGRKRRATRPRVQNSQSDYNCANYM